MPNCALAPRAMLFSGLHLTGGFMAKTAQLQKRHKAVHVGVGRDTLDTHVFMIVFYMQYVWLCMFAATNNCVDSFNSIDSK